MTEVPTFCEGMKSQSVFILTSLLFLPLPLFGEGSFPKAI